MLFLLPSLKLCIVGYICILWFLPGNSIYSAYCLIHASKNILTVFSRLDRPWLPLNLFFAVFLLFYPSLFLTQTPSPWLPSPPPLFFLFLLIHHIFLFSSATPSLIACLLSWLPFLVSSSSSSQKFLSHTSSCPYSLPLVVWKIQRLQFSFFCRCPRSEPHLRSVDCRKMEGNEGYLVLLMPAVLWGMSGCRVENTGTKRYG